MVRFFKASRKQAIAFILCLVPFSAFAGIAVIANASVTATALTPEQVSDIFLGKARTFPNGEKAIPIDQGMNSSTRDAFYLTGLKKSDSDMKSYWSHVVFTGKGHPPLQQEGGDEAIKALVQKNPTLLGYVDSKSVDTTVKVLLTVE